MFPDTLKSHERVPLKAFLARELSVASPWPISAFDHMVCPCIDQLLSGHCEARSLSQTRS